MSTLADSGFRPALNKIPPASASMVQIEGVPPSLKFVPSRFNARTTDPDGTLVLYNSLHGAISGFPAKVRDHVEQRLHRAGFEGRLEGLTKYLYDRGFLVQRGIDELQRLRLLYGNQQYKQDRLELILLSSEECNFRCVYCYENFPRGTMEPWVRSAILKMVERLAPRLNDLSVSWF